MSFAYTPFKTRLLKKTAPDFDAPDDIRVLLVMTNTTADTEQDAEFVANITTLDEMDGANYVRKALAGEVVNEDAPNNRAEFDTGDVTWSALGAGTRSMAGIVLYQHVTNDADSPLIAYIDTGGFPLAANGGDILASFSIEGVLQTT